MKIKRKTSDYQYLIFKLPVFAVPKHLCSRHILKGNLKTGFLKFILCIYYNIFKKIGFQKFKKLGVKMNSTNKNVQC